MKKMLLFTFASFLLICGNAFGQLSISKDSVGVTLQEGVKNYGYITVSNTSGATIKWNWRKLNSTIDSNWWVEFCDCSICVNYLPDDGSCFDLMDGQSKEFKLGLELNGGTFSEQSLALEINDITNGIKDTITFVSEMFNSVNTIENRGVISTYPNPVVDVLTINTTAFQTTADLNANLLDLTGRIVKRLNITSTVQEVDLNAVPNGIYVLELREGAESLTTEKIIVNR